jgi:hypothetical protein
MIVFGANTADNGLGVVNTATNYTYSDVAIGDSIFTGTLVFSGSYGVTDGAPPTKFPKYVFNDQRTGEYSDGKGISINGVIGRANGTNLLASFNTTTFEDNAFLSSAMDFGGVGFGTRVGGGKVKIYGPLVMDGRSVYATNYLNPNYVTNTFTLYNPFAGSPTTFIEIRGTNGAKFWGFYEDGYTELPGTLQTEGSITNKGNYEGISGLMYLYDHYTNRSALVYNIGNGGVGIEANTSDPKFLVLYPNGLLSVEHSIAFSHVVTNAALEAILSDDSQLNDSVWFQQEAGGASLRTYSAGVPYYTIIQPGGNWTFANDITVPGTITGGTINLNALNTATLNIQTNLVFSATNNVPSNTNAVKWLPVVVDGVTGSIPWMANP